MSRPRSRDPFIPISLSIPTSLKMKLENHLGYAESRSKWICGAVEDKMLGIKHSSHEDRTTRQLIAQLSQREDIDGTLRTILQNALRGDQL